MTTARGSAQIDMVAGTAENTSTRRLTFPTLIVKNGNASVGVTVGYALPFSKGKVSVTLTLRCDQEEDMIDQAVDMATYRASELAVEGLRLVADKLRELEEEGLL